MLFLNEKNIFSLWTINNHQFFFWSIEITHADLLFNEKYYGFMWRWWKVRLIRHLIDDKEPQISVVLSQTECINWRYNVGISMSWRTTVWFIHESFMENRFRLSQRSILSLETYFWCDLLHNIVNDTNYCG